MKAAGDTFYIKRAEGEYVCKLSGKWTAAGRYSGYLHLCRPTGQLCTARESLR